MKLWQELVSSAIVGTDRQKFTLSALGDDMISRILQTLDGAENETALLQSAAIIGSYRCAGIKTLPDKETAPETASDENLRFIGKQSEQHLATMLAGNHKDVLPEFLQLSAKHKRVMPPQFLPEILDLGTSERDLREAVLPVLGERGRWLAGQNAEWNWALAEEKAVEIWQDGARDERQFALEFLRRQQPEKARELLAADWKSDSARDRAAFLEILQTNLSESDEPFLDEVLRSDKSAEVREKAFDLLASLPQSRLVRELTARAEPLLRFKMGEEKPEIEVEFPESWDEKNFNFEFLDFKKSETDLGRKGWTLVQLLGATPLAVWENKFTFKTTHIRHLVVADLEGKFPVKQLQIVEAITGNIWTAELFLGFMTAAARQNNEDWFTALLFGFSDEKNEKAFDGKYRSRTIFDDYSRKFVLGYSLERIEAMIDETWSWRDEPMHDDHSMMSLMTLNQQQWSEKISRFFIERCQQSFSVEYKPDNKIRLWRTIQFFPQAARFVPVALADEQLFEPLENYRPETQKAIEHFEQLLKFRREIFDSFEQEN